MLGTFSCPALPAAKSVVCPAVAGSMASSSMMPTSIGSTMLMAALKAGLAKMAVGPALTGAEKYPKHVPSENPTMSATKTKANTLVEFDKDRPEFKGCVRGISGVRSSLCCWGFIVPVT